MLPSENLSVKLLLMTPSSYIIVCSFLHRTVDCFEMRHGKKARSPGETVNDSTPICREVCSGFDSDELGDTVPCSVGDSDNQYHNGAKIIVMRN